MGYIYVSIILYLVFATREEWNPSHPIVWYIPFVILYSFSAVLLHYRGYHELKNPDEVSTIGFLSVVSGVIFITAADWWIGKNRDSSLKVKKYISKNSLLLSFYGVLFISVFYMGYVYSSGVSSKPELLRSDIIYFGVIYGVLNTFSLLMVVRSVMRRERLPVLPVVITIGTFFLAVLVLGQRDFIFRYLIGLILILGGLDIINKWHVYISGFLMIFSVPVMGSMKSYVLSGRLGGLEGNVVLSILSGEFRSAGRNMDTLISRASEWEYQYGETIITDVLRGVVPSPIYRFENPTNWFRNELHPELASKGMGPGFTFAGEGFINFGYIGVAIWFFVVSVLITGLYKYKNSSVFAYITYISSVPIFIYSLRADMANIISPILKHVVVPLFMLWGLSAILKRCVPVIFDDTHPRSTTVDDR